MAQLDEIVGKENIQQFVDIDAKINKMTESLYNQIKAVKEYQAILSSSNVTLKELNSVQQKTVDATKKLSEEEKQAAKIAKDLERELKKKADADAKAAKAAADHNAALKLEVKSLEDATRQNKALQIEKKKLNLTTAEGKKQNQEYNKIINQNTEFIRKNSDAATKQRMNVGNYTSSIKAAIASMGPFGQTINNVTNNFNSFTKILIQSAAAQKAAAVGTGIFSGALRILKVALISTGIGALIVAIGSLAAFFTQTERGAESLKKILAGFGAVIKVLIDRVVAFGEGLFKIFSGEFASGLEEIKGAFVGITEEISKEYTLARKLAEELENIKDFQRAASVEQERLNLLKQQELEIARDSEQPTQARLKAWQQATKFTKESLAITKASNEMEMANLKNRIAMGENSEAVMDSIAALQAKMYQDEANAQQSINALFKLGNGLRAKAADEAERAARAANLMDGTEQIAFTGQIEQAKTDIVVDQLEQRKQANIDFFADEKRRRQENVDEWLKENEDKINVSMATIATLKEIGGMLFESQAAEIQMLIDENTRAKEHELKLAGDNAAMISRINEKYAAKERSLKIKAAENNKKAAMFNAIIGTAQAVINGLMTQPIWVGLIMAALAGVLGGVQIGLISSQPIPQFFKGTKSAPDGLISVAEKGQEMIQTRSGKVLMATQPTILSGMKGAQIYSNKETEAILKGRNVGFDTSELRSELKENNRQLIRAIQNKKETYFDFAKREIREREGGYWTNYKGRYFR